MFNQIALSGIHGFYIDTLFTGIICNGFTCRITGFDVFQPVLLTLLTNNYMAHYNDRRDTCSSVNPNMRICSCLKITLVEPQIVCVTGKDSIGYHEIKED